MVSSTPLKKLSRGRLCALFTALLVFAAHGYRFLSLSFGGDAAYISMDGTAAYQVSLGRFLQPVYWAVRGWLVVPSVVGLFTAAFLALSCVLIARMLNLSRPRDLFLLSGLLVTHETFAVSGASYLPWMDVYALALLFASLGAYVFLLGGWKAWLSPVFFVLSLGLYQSYLPSAAALIILVLMRRTIDGEKPGRVFRTGLLACLAIAAGLVLYALAFNCALSIVGRSVSYDYNGIGSMSSFDFASVPRYLLDTVLTPLRFLFVPDSGAIPSHTPSISPYLNLALLALALVMLAFRVRGLGAGSKAMLALLALLLIPASNFIQFIWQGLVHGLTIYAYVFFDVAVLLLAASALRAQKPLVRAAAGCAQLLLCVVILQNALLANQLVLKRDLELSSTLSVTARILDEAEQTEGYVPGETPVVIVGMLPNSSVSMERPGYEAIARHQGARYTYAIPYEGANAAYFRSTLGANLYLVDSPGEASLPPEASDMPAFPLAGCTRLIDGVLYIRFS